ncbi:MAG: hypothetical protein JXB26_16630, partial [Candidatus Aminicenantes bacterium]|nr:hypothetical protein [Candidatus Aminicenantes bacterium]
MFLKSGKINNFEYLGKKEYEFPDGSIFKIPCWWDEEIEQRLYLYVTSRTFYPSSEWTFSKTKELPNIKPESNLNEREFLKKFNLSRRNFYYSIKRLSEENFLKFSVYSKDEKVSLNQKSYRQVKSIERGFKYSFINLTEEEIIYCLEKAFEEELGISLKIDQKNKKKYYYKEVQPRRKGRFWELSNPLVEYIQVPLKDFRKISLSKRMKPPYKGYKVIKKQKLRFVRYPKYRILQFPLNILTRKDLTIA